MLSFRRPNAPKVEASVLVRVSVYLDTTDVAYTTLASLQPPGLTPSGPVRVKTTRTPGTAFARVRASRVCMACGHTRAFHLL